MYFFHDSFFSLLFFKNSFSTSSRRPKWRVVFFPELFFYVWKLIIKVDGLKKKAWLMCIWKKKMFFLPFRTIFKFSIFNIPNPTIWSILLPIINFVFVLLWIKRAHSSQRHQFKDSNIQKYVENLMLHLSSYTHIKMFECCLNRDIVALARRRFVIVYIYIGAHNVNMFFHLIAFLILAFFFYFKKREKTCSNIEMPRSEPPTII